MGAEDRFWTRRLRWRLLGAWRWPAFAIAALVDGILLHELSPGREQIDFPVALIYSSFGNFFLIVAADVLARYAQRKRAERGIEDPHLEVQVDRGAVIALALGVLGVLGWGLSTNEARVLETEALEENADAVKSYVEAHGGEEYRRNLDTANTARLKEDYFRTCVADDERERFLCLFVDTSVDPPKVTRDPTTLPNNEVVGEGG